MALSLEDMLAGEIADKLTEPMKAALRDADPDMFDHGKVHAHGPVMAALRKRNIVAAAPHCHLTEIGAQVARAVQS